MKKTPSKKEKKSKKVETSVLKRKEDAGVAAMHIIRPHVTEKAAALGEHFAYTFEVASTANKVHIKKAIKALYGVTPIKVNMVNVSSRNVFVRGRRGVTARMKKAIVYLEKGQVIEFI